MKVGIKQKHLDEGVPSDQHACALAQAFCSMGYDQVVVAENHRRRAVVWDNGQGFMEISLTDEAMEFVDDFDHRHELKEPLKPRVLELPDPRPITCGCGDDDEDGCEVHDS